ncbi:MAG: hypothetical protein JW807_09710 [Spirochaetes bacterium]|nr:hypothetical protein [Spirochaetota bacterium]
MIRVSTYMALILLVALFAISCGLHGEFGFKKFGEDAYRRIDSVPEFAGGEAVDWVYAIRKVSGEMDIGVVYQKKELVWVEVYTQTSRINKKSRAVYGTIKDLDPGEYQILITDARGDNRLIDSKHFIIYENGDDGD